MTQATIKITGLGQVEGAWLKEIKAGHFMLIENTDGDE